MIYRMLFLLSLLAAVACSRPGQVENEPPATTSAVTIMSFNVQNLFDNVDDPDNDDKAYLAIEAKQSTQHIDECNTIPVASWRAECLELDWSDAAIEHKLSAVAAAIKQVDDGRGPDIIALQEVENRAILERLRTEFLSDSGYLPAILIEGTDTRGIDVAFLSRLPLAEPAVLHPLILKDFPDRAGDTRGVLEATFVLPDGTLLTGFSVHFPAPFHPTEMRVIAYDHLNTLREYVRSDRQVFAAGDFNTSSTEDARENMLDRFARPYWTVSNDACDGCVGTNYYATDDIWSYLDMILFSPACCGKTTWAIRADSVTTANRLSMQMTEAGTPRRYNSAAQTGVSDHWPVIATIEPSEKQ